MSAHTHSQHVDGCYRCELGRDEAVAAAIEILVSRGIDTIEKYDALIAAMDSKGDQAQEAGTSV